MRAVVRLYSVLEKKSLFSRKVWVWSDQPYQVACGRYQQNTYTNRVFPRNAGPLQQTHSASLHMEQIFVLITITTAPDMRESKRSHTLLRSISFELNCGPSTVQRARSLMHPCRMARHFSYNRQTTECLQQNQVLDGMDGRCTRSEELRRYSRQDVAE